MARLILHPTTTAQWQALVNEAENAAHCTLNEDLQSYLVFLLMRFTNRPELLSQIIAEDYLLACNTSGQNKQIQLREVGDHCLLFSGLFPNQAQRRLVKASYFVDMGRSAYQILAESIDTTIAKLYALLSQNFVMLMDILQAMRHLNPDHEPLSPLQAFDLWHDTNSQHAHKILSDTTSATPMKDTDTRKSIKIIH